jgi:aminoglycoside 3-N-acetyltransferase
MRVPSRQLIRGRLTQSVRELVPEGVVTWAKRRRSQWQKQQRQRQRAARVAAYGTFGSAELVAACRDAGIDDGAVLFVQCSYDDLLTYEGTPYELLKALGTVVGPTGTLLMPAYTTNMAVTPCRLFDVLREPTYTGIVPELFRREDGVIRSLHPRHSITGIGPLASDLLADHHECVYADGAGSPFDRLRAIDGAKSLCLGMRPGFHSFVHWVEDIEPDRFPLPTHEGPFECELRDAAGTEIRRPFFRRPGHLINQDQVIGTNLGPDAMSVHSLRGVRMCVYRWPALASELLALRDRGIVCFA